MKPSILSEVKDRVRKVLILTKVEKYVHVGNHWILETSGKALDQAHKATQVIKRLELEQYFQTGRVGAEHYLQQSKHWLSSTSERALTEAYNAAQILKQIEDEHFTGTEVAAIANYSDSVSTYFHLVSKKYLLIIQVRLLEFRVSHSIRDTSSFSDSSVELQAESGTILDKLKFIDEVLIRYRTQQTNAALPREDSGFASRRTADLSEQEIRNQLTSQLGNQFNRQLDDHIGNHSHQWKPIGLLQLPFRKESSFDSPLKTTVEPLSQAQPLPPRANRNLVANAGIASLLVAGGFAAGGVCAWAVLSVQNSLASEAKNPPSEGMHSNQASTTTPRLSAIASPSAAERMPPESSGSEEKPTEQATKQATADQPPGAAQIYRESMGASSPEATIARPGAPESLPLETSFSGGKTAPVAANPTNAPFLSTTKAPLKTAVASPNTAQKLLTPVDLQGRSANELTIMRNEIYARHGRRFGEPELQRHFESQSWYQPRYSSEEFPVALLSKTEIQNAILIREYQRAHGLE